MKAVLSMVIALTSQFAFAFDIGLPSHDTKTYEWTQGDESYLNVQPGDYIAEFTLLSNIDDYPSGGFDDPDVFYVIYRSSGERALLEQYMETYPNSLSKFAILAFEVYLGKPTYDHRKIVGQGTSYESPLGVFFKPDIGYGVAEFAPEVCDGLPYHYNFHGVNNDNTLSVGIDPIKYDGVLAPAPSYCPWAHPLKSVRVDGKEIWTFQKGSL